MLGEPRVTELVEEALRGAGATLGPRLRPGFDALCARQGWLRGEVGYYTAPESQPILVLPLLLAEALAPRLTAPAVEASLESAMLGYAAVRVQDDWLDDGIGGEDPAATALLADALYAHHQAATARAAGEGEAGAAFWALFARTWSEYGEAMLLERELLRGPGAGAAPYDAAAFERVLLRSRPMLLPAAALLARARAWDRLPALVELVHESAKASQLLNDGLDVLRDFDAGRWNHLVQRFGGLHGRTALATGWVLGGFSEAWEEAGRAMGRAEGAAETLGIGPGFARFARARAELLESLRRKAWEAATGGGAPRGR